MHPKIIEINPTELCNRKCNFCPRGSGYPNANQNLSLVDAKLIYDKLIEFDYEGFLHLTGFGEPVLNPNFINIVNIFKKNLKLKLVMTTNGDYIGKKDITFFKYFDNIRISIYDNDERYEYVINQTKKYNVTVRKQYTNHDLFNNCGGWFSGQNLVNNSCYYPFYKLLIDWNLDIRLCCHDWKYKKVLGNLKDDNLHHIWYNSFKEIRTELLDNKRKNISPCNECNVNGMLNVYTNVAEGEQHFNYFKEYYGKNI